MGNNHGHNHTHSDNKKVLFLSFLIITTYMAVEAVGGFLTNSLALLADAGHMLSDSISLGVALLAFTFGAKAANKNKTFGYKRFEILAAVFNGVTLVVIALFIFIEAVKRFAHPPEVATTGMLIVSSIGLAVNVLVAFIMVRGADVEENLNMKGAYLHVIGDMLGSIGAISAALLMMFFGWNWADPLASVIVAALVLRSGLFVSRAGLHVLMEGVPQNVDMNAVIKVLQETKGLKSVHDVHVWSITSGFNAFSCHALVDEQMTVAESELILHNLERALLEQNIQHVTVQLETSAHEHDDSILCQASPETTHEHHH